MKKLYYESLWARKRHERVTIGRIMLAVVLATLSAVGYGSAQFMTQLGLRHGRVRSAQAVLINLIAANLVLALALGVVWTLDPVDVQWRGVAYFAVAGLLGPFAGRSLNFMAIQRVGATRTASLGMSESLFAAALAWLVLGQTLSILTLVGMAVLVVGMALFVNETGRAFRRADAMAPGESDRDDMETAPAAGRISVGKIKVGLIAMGVGLALSSGLFFSFAGIMRQLGINLIPSAVLGAAVGSFVALAVTLLNVIRAGQLRGVFQVRSRDAAPLAASGVLASAGMVCFFLALQLGGELAVSTALKNLTPLFTFALSALFIAHLERITVRLGFLVALVVAGAVIMTVGRG